MIDVTYINKSSVGVLNILKRVKGLETKNLTDTMLTMLMN